MLRTTAPDNVPFISACCFYLVEDTSRTNLGRQQIPILFISLFMPQKFAAYGGPEGSVPPNPFDETATLSEMSRP